MKRLLVCLLLVGVVGCGESEQVAQEPSENSQQVAQEPSEEIQKESSPGGAQSNANLTACPDCEKEVSKRATACPHCGAPLSAKTIVNSIGMKLTLIPAGEFQMGSPGAEPGRVDDETRHLVKITKPFYLGVYEITQQQYEKVMGARPWQGEDYVKEGADYPAVYVSHVDAVEFCRKLSKEEGVEYRLPTEAEWEYACRAGTTTAYSFGDDEAKLGQCAWYENSAWDIGEEYAHRVGQKLPNPWGLYDIHGNVFEWCQDLYALYGNEKVVSDPVGSAQGVYRVFRGGSFTNPPSSVRSAYRATDQPVSRADSLGFRVVRTYNVSP
jgi:formylglycine-generating enzyme required for sulfatase activity